MEFLFKVRINFGVDLAIITQKGMEKPYKVRNTLSVCVYVGQSNIIKTSAGSLSWVTSVDEEARTIDGVGMEKRLERWTRVAGGNRRKGRGRSGTGNESVSGLFLSVALCSPIRVRTMAKQRRKNV